MKRLPIVLIVLLALSALIAQLTMGNIPMSLFSFPINVAFLLLLFGITQVLYREARHTKAVQTLMSTTTSVVLIALSFVGSLVIAFAPSLQFQQSWFFNLILMFLLANLQMVVLRYKGAFRKRFYLTHVGLYLFIIGLAFGAPDTHKSRAAVYEGQTIDRAYDFDGHIRPIGYSLTLNKFEITYYDNNVPRSFKAEVSSGTEHQTIKVNHPWTRSWKEDIYLVSHGVDQATNKPYCVLEFIVQPWKYIVHIGLLLTALGAFLLMLGKKKIKTL